MGRRPFIQRVTGLKFMSAAFFALFVFISEVLGWPISYQAYAAIAAGLGFFIVGEAYVDGKAAGK